MDFEIYFNPTLPTFPKSGGTVELTVTFIHNEHFTFTENTSRPDWCLTEETGRVESGDTTTITYDLTAEAYEGSEARTGYLTFEIEYSDGDESEFFEETMAITQLSQGGTGLDGELTFTKTSAADYFDEDKGAFILPSTLSGDSLPTGCKIVAAPSGSVWKTEIDNPEDWVTLEKDAQGNVTMDVTPNTGDSQREAVCTVTAYLTNTITGEDTDVTKEYLLRVRQTGIEYTFEIEPEATEIRHGKQRIRMDIRKSGNIFGVYLAGYPDYVTLVVLTDTYAVVEFAENEGDEARTATFTFNATDTGGSTITRQVTVTQEAFTAETLFVYAPMELHNTAGTDRLGFIASYDIDNLEVSIIDGSTWVTVTDIDYDDNAGTIVYTYTRNDTVSRRSATVEVTAADEDGNYLTRTVKIYQAPASEYVESPVWTDQYLTIRNSEYEGEYLQYKISLNNEKNVYFGRIYIDRNGEYTRARLNGIFSNYITENIDFTENLALQDNGGHVNFYVYVSTDNWATSNLQGVYREYYDYSYRVEYPNVLSMPLKPVLDGRQRFAITVRNYYSDGIPNQLRLFINNHGQAPIIENFENGTYTYLINDLSGVHDIYVEMATGEEMHYRVSQDCRHRYCLYYRNDYGGYDSLLFDGREIHKEKIEAKTYGRAFDNTRNERQTIDYEKVITDSWELTTGYLTNEEARKMAHILHSTDVWLQDMEDGRDVIPVRITDNSYDEKTWRNTKKPFLYTVKVEGARNKWLK